MKPTWEDIEEFLRQDAAGEILAFGASGPVGVVGARQGPVLIVLPGPPGVGDPKAALVLAIAAMARLFRHCDPERVMFAFSGRMHEPARSTPVLNVLDLEAERGEMVLHPYRARRGGVRWLRPRRLPEPGWDGLGLVEAARKTFEPAGDDDFERAMRAVLLAGHELYIPEPTPDGSPDATPGATPDGAGQSGAKSNASEFTQ